MSINKDNNIGKTGLLFNKSFHRFIIGFVVLLISYVVVLNGAESKKFQMKEGDKSEYVIYATREVEDTITTRKLQQEAVAKVTTKYSLGEEVTENALKSISVLFQNVIYLKSLALAEEKEINDVLKNLKAQNVLLNNSHIVLLINLNYLSLENFEDELSRIIKQVIALGITEESLDRSIREAKEEINKSTLIPNEAKGIATSVCLNVIKPNLKVDKMLTDRARKDAESMASNIVKYKKGQVIVRKDDKVTLEQIEILKKLDLIKIKGKIDYPFLLSVFVLMCIIGTIYIIYLYNYQKELFYSRSDLILLGIIFILTLIMARGFSEVSVYLIPIAFAAILISILLNVGLAVFTNIILTCLIAIITKGDVNFIYLSLIGGTFAAFAVSRADQRKKLALAGTVISLTYGLVIMCFGIVNKEEFNRVIIDSGIGVVNGLFSIVIAIGTLPFWESTFNVITPLKLLELSNPNQPLIKRLLLEAPGTYHHSLLVGNLAEVATEAIGGNALLARVAAYFHDIGKLKRPYFFKENQYANNPHERMTPSLSTLVITSHTRDGVELAEQYSIPLAIRDIIKQHHGTTLVAYFFHKAKQSERLENQAKQESFRYEGPRPTTKEAAVVMLADSVEAAVRSMPDKSEGRVEGLVRKIIKDKLEDGQLDLCDLTLKDLDLIARSFMNVLNGCFHGRIEYPEITDKAKELEDREIQMVDPFDVIVSEEEQLKKGESYESVNSK